MNSESDISLKKSALTPALSPRRGRNTRSVLVNRAVRHVYASCLGWCQNCALAKFL